MVEDERDALREELAGLWSKVRRAFAEYRLDDAIPYLEIPAGEPRPSREDAAALAEFLPDIDRARIIGCEREGDVAAIFAETSRDPGETEVTVFRFRQAGGAGAPGSAEGAWKILSSPHSCSSHSVDKTDEAGIRRLLAESPSLGLLPRE